VALLETLEARFKANERRHEGIPWEKVRARLEARPDRLKSLGEMERTGGEPDVVGQDMYREVAGASSWVTVE
jgi:hypothetical protein